MVALRKLLVAIWILFWCFNIFASEIHEAIQARNIDKVKKLLEDKPELINASDGNNRYTPLHYAVISSDKQMVALLIAKGADVNGKNAIDETPLYCAEKKEMAELLVAAGANINIKDKIHLTPLDCAAHRGCLDLVEYFVAKGAARDLGKPINMAALGHFMDCKIAGYGRNKGVIEFLISKGFDVNAKDEGGDTALHGAVEMDKLEMADFLFTKGMKVDTQGKGGRTPLFTAVMRGNVLMAKWLLEKGADVNAKDLDGCVPLHYAKTKEVAQFLVEKGGHE